MELRAVRGAGRGTQGCLPRGPANNLHHLGGFNPVNEQEGVRVPPSSDSRRYISAWPGIADRNEHVGAVLGGLFQFGGKSGLGVLVRNHGGYGSAQGLEGLFELLGEPLAVSVVDEEDTVAHNPARRPAVARTTPWLASDTTVRNRKSSSSSTVIAGEVDEGDIRARPFGTVTDCATAIVTPLASAPTIATTFSTSTSARAESTP